MAQIKVYHNPRFLDYRDNHNNIVPPMRPVAIVQVADDVPADEALETAYRQTQHLDDVPGGWWNREGVALLVRSTSVGDMLEDEAGHRFVVENLGFKPYRPDVVTNAHPLAHAYQLLDTALEQQSQSGLSLTRQARDILLRILEDEGCPDGELPVFTWDKAQVGDLVGSPTLGLYRVVARKLRPKWRAKRLLAHVPNAQICMDTPRSWAVLVPVNQEGQP